MVNNSILGRTVGAVGVQTPIRARLQASYLSKAQSNGRPNIVSGLVSQRKFRLALTPRTPAGVPSA